jgi:hypothetical protein
MGAVAARSSDLVIVTSDNPRSENPEQIIEEIKRGIVPPADRAGKSGAKPTLGPAISCSSRGRDTRSTRRSAIAFCRSTTSR